MCENSLKMGFSCYLHSLTHMKTLKLCHISFLMRPLNEISNQCMFGVLISIFNFFGMKDNLLFFGLIQLVWQQERTRMEFSSFLHFHSSMKSICNQLLQVEPIYHALFGPLKKGQVKVLHLAGNKLP